MIIITSKGTTNRTVLPGDHFVLSIREGGREVDRLEEEITETMEINFYCSFRFAREDGTIVSPHLSGFFGNSANLPEEIKNAVYWEDLPTWKRTNTINSSSKPIGQAKVAVTMVYFI